ncbi:hypothetical protein TNCV_3929871 [Trichonephila clavipes]|nr:hypothetical protein TNCV_3929871 [Trichonephila clavipes]
MGFSRQTLGSTLPPVTIRELRLALQDEWAAMPQQLIDTLILSMGRCCETCLEKQALRAKYLSVLHVLHLCPTQIAVTKQRHWLGLEFRKPLD